MLSLYIRLSRHGTLVVLIIITFSSSFFSRSPSAVGLSHHRFLSKLGLFLVTFSAFCFHSSSDPTRNRLSRISWLRQHGQIAAFSLKSAFSLLNHCIDNLNALCVRIDSEKVIIPNKTAHILPYTSGHFVSRQILTVFCSWRHVILSREDVLQHEPPSCPGPLPRLAPQFAFPIPTGIWELDLKISPVQIPKFPSNSQLPKARSRLHRSQILQVNTKYIVVNTHWKTLD